MLKILVNNTDITDRCVLDSLSINEQLQNRANTCNFESYQKVVQNQLVEIWSGTTTTQSTLVTDTVINIYESFEYFERFRAGDEIVFDVENTKIKRIIQSINHTNRTITLTSQIGFIFPIGTSLGKKVFAGVVLNAPEEEITAGPGTPTLFYSVQCNDYNTLLDRKTIVDTYLNQYPKEVIGRAVYKFVASDKQVTLDLFESAWTQSGTANAMIDETNTNYVIQGLKCQKASQTVGTGLYTKTITSTDLSDTDKLRVWYKTSVGEGDFITTLKYRIGSDVSNYFEFNCNYINGVALEDCYHLESFFLNEPSVTVGSPSLANITWLQIETVSTANITGLWFDVLHAVKNGFCVDGMARGDTKIEEARFQYQKPSVVINKISKLHEYFWHVDFDRNIKMYAKDSTNAPYTLTSTSENFGELIIEADASELKNMQVVRGGEAPDENLYTQEEFGDGLKTSWYLDYKPKSIAVYTDTGAGYVQKTIGIENLDNEATVDYVFNFNEKTLRKATASVLSSTDKIKITYYPYKAIRVRYKDQDSIDMMKALTGGDGIYEGGAITDTNIQTWDEARKRAKVEVETYKNPVVTATFITEKEGLRAGQIINIVDVDRGINENYLIQKISAKQKAKDYFVYNVQAGTTLFGMIEFFQLLLNSRDNAGNIIDKSETVDIVENVDEILTLTESYSFAQKTTPFKVANKENKRLEFNSLLVNSIASNGYVTNEATLYGTTYRNDLYGKFTSAVGSIALNNTLNYTDEKQIQLVKTSGTTVSSYTALLDVKPSTIYRIGYWLKIVSNGGAGNTLIKVKEYEYQPVEYIEIINTTIKTIANTDIQEDYKYFYYDLITNTNTDKIRFFIEASNDISLSIADIRIDPTVEVETQTNAGVVGFCEVG